MTDVPTRRHQNYYSRGPDKYTDRRKKSFSKKSSLTKSAGTLKTEKTICMRFTILRKKKDLKRPNLSRGNLENSLKKIRITIWLVMTVFSAIFTTKKKFALFCRKPRTKEVLAKQFGFDEKHPAYFMKNYIIPLIEEGKLKYTIPEKPKSKNQQIVVAKS